MKFALAIALTATTLFTSATAFALSCSVNKPAKTVNCSATFKRAKSELSDAAHNNCKGNGFAGFAQSSGSYGDCNSNGTKCKKLNGSCISQPTGTSTDGPIGGGASGSGLGGPSKFKKGY